MSTIAPAPVTGPACYCMSKRSTPTRSVRRTLVRRSAKLLAAAIVLLLLIVAGGYWFLLSPTRVAAMARNALAERTGAAVTVGQATLDMSGQIDLRDIVLRVPDMEGEGAELFRAEHVRLLIDRGALWRGRVELLDVVIDEPRVTIAEDRATGRLNFQMVQPEPRDEAKLKALPRMEIIGGSIRMGEMRGERFLTAGQIDIDGILQADEDDPELFHLSLIETEAGRTRRGGLVILGSVNIATRVGQAEVKGIDFSDRFRALLPSAARDLWRRTDPVGTLNEVAFAYEPDTGWRALVEFSDVELTLPRSTDADYRFRMIDGSGALRFDRGGVTIVKDLVGKVSGLEYAIAGSWDGYSPDAAFRLGFRSEPFAVPNEPRVILALPEGVQKAFRIFSPEGNVRVSMSAWREGDGGEIDYEGAATFTDGKGRYERFPYELDNLRGKIRFTPEEVRLLSVVGQTSGGGSATITGVIAPPGRFPAVDLTVAAVNVPFDQRLYEALNERQRPALDMFFHEASYRMLREAGHFQSIDAYNAGELDMARLRRQRRGLPDDAPEAERQRLDRRIAELDRQLAQPPFELGGRGNLIVHITREEGPDARSTAVTEVELQEANIVFKYFPYPMHVTQGRLRIQPGLLEIFDVEATGFHGGRIGLRGKVGLPRGREQRGHVEPDLEIFAMDAPIDDLLHDALPKPQDQWVRNLYPTGRIDVLGRIFAAGEGRTDIDLVIDVSDGTLTPGNGAFDLTDVEAKLRLSLGDLRIEHLRGRHGEGTLAVEGKLDWRDDVGVAVALDVATRKLRFEDPIFDALEPFIAVDDAWRTFLEASELAGVFDADVTFQQSAAGEVDRDIEIRPARFSFVRGGRRVQVAEAAGKLHLRTDRLDIEQLRGTVGGAAVAVDGSVMFQPELTCRATMQLTGDRITDELKAALPVAVVDSIDAMSIDGRFDANFERFTYRPNAPVGEPIVALTGNVELTDGVADIGVDVADLTGGVGIDYTQRQGKAHALAKLTLDAESLLVMGRRVTDMHANLVSSEKTGNLALPKIRGRIYDGAVGGYGAVSPGDKTFRFRLQLSDVDLHKFLVKADGAAPAPGGAEAGPAGEDEPAMRGVLSAALDVEGDWSAERNLRARGDVQIREGTMYRLPLALGLLQISHLSLPLNDSFSRATITYHMQKDKVRFERIVLESPNMRMAGDGEMDAGTRKLDLTLTTSNPGGVNLGPVTDMVNSLRDQLITIRVTGTLDEPKTEVKQLSGLTQAWRDVFGTPQQQRD